MIPYSLLNALTGDSSWQVLWLQMDVCFPPGKMWGVGTLRKSLPLGEGLEVLPFPRLYPRQQQHHQAMLPLPRSPGSPVCTWSAATACGGSPAVQSPLLPWNSHVQGGLGEPSLWARQSEVFEVLQQAGVRCLVWRFCPASQQAGLETRSVQILLCCMGDICK